MKVQLLAAAGVLALLGGAAHAQTVVNGYAGAGYDYTGGTDKFTETSEGTTTSKIDQNTNGYYFDGAISVPVTSLIGVQGDLAYGNSATHLKETFSSGSPDQFGFHDDGTVATVHVFARTADWLAGAFVGENDSGEGTLKGGGVEGQYYMGPFTFEGSLGAATQSLGFDFFGSGFQPHMIAVRVGARYFVSPDFVVGVHAGYMDGDTTFHEDSSLSEDFQAPGLFTVGVGGEYKVPGQPVTVTLNYEHGDSSTHVTDNEGLDEHLKLIGDDVSVGVRWNFGGSLLERDRHGASLPTFKDLFGGQFGSGLLETLFEA